MDEKIKQDKVARNKKIIKIVGTIVIFLAAFFFVSIWAEIFKELTINAFKEGKMGLFNLFKIVRLIPMFIFAAILLKKFSAWKKKKREIAKKNETTEL